MYTHVNLRTYTETEVWKVLEVYLLNFVQTSHLKLEQTRLIEKTGWPLMYIVWSKSKRVTSRKLTGLAMRIPQRPFLRFFLFQITKLNGKQSEVLQILWLRWFENWELRWLNIIYCDILNCSWWWQQLSVIETTLFNFW